MNLPIVRNLWQQDMTRREMLLAAAKSTAITCVTAWLYYQSFFAVLPLIPFWLWHYKMGMEEKRRQKEGEFQGQFKEAIQTMAGALNTGYSVENALRETQKELLLQYPEDARISQELLFMVRQLRMQIPMEQVLDEFADRTEQEDIRQFATVFAAAKKSGGDMIAIIRNTVNQIGDKIDVKREILTILAAKQYEFRVMTAIPYGIIAYMCLSFPEFMKTLYGNVIGIGVMTGCLGIYAGAYYLGVRILRIEV